MACKRKSKLLLNCTMNGVILRNRGMIHAFEMFFQLPSPFLDTRF
jgi:hypothetical protein